MRVVNGTNIHWETYEYNGLKKIAKLTYGDNSNNPNTQSHIDVEYNGDGKISKHIAYLNNKATATAIYTYDAGGLLIKKSWFKIMPGNTPDSLLWYAVFTYHPTNKLKRKSSYNGLHEQFHYTDFSYPSANAVRKEDFTISPGLTSMAGITDYTFDNNNGLSRFTDVLYEDRLISDHNVISESIFDRQTNTTSFSYSYSYNQQGFPTRKSSPNSLNVTTYTFKNI
jgi:hypothetical protein